MNAPLFEYGILSENASLMAALVIGLAFGFFLERGGLGNATKLAGQFYLRDLTVLKVLFTAILTAMLGLYWLGRFNFLDLDLVYQLPTFVLPQLTGGLIFGVGFVMGGLCPGTSCVSMSSGRTDGLALMGGMLFGIFLFNEIFPFVAGFYDSTPLGQVTIPQLIGLPHGVVVFGVVLAALGSFVIAERLERATR